MTGTHAEWRAILRGRLLLLLLLHWRGKQGCRGLMLLLGDLVGNKLLQQLAQFADAGCMVAVEIPHEALVLVVQALECSSLMGLQRRLQRCNSGVHGCAQV